MLISDYSGVGTAEMSMAMIIEALQYHGVVGAGVSFTVYRVCDNEKACQQVLNSYSTHRPQHILSNILDRGPAGCVQHLRCMLDGHRSEYHQALVEGEMADSCLLRHHGHLFMKEACKYMRNVEFNNTSPCTRQQPSWTTQSWVQNGLMAALMANMTGTVKATGEKEEQSWATWYFTLAVMVMGWVILQGTWRLVGRVSVFADTIYQGKIQGKTTTTTTASTQTEPTVKEVIVCPYGRVFHVKPECWGLRTASSTRVLPLCKVCG